MGIEVQHFYDEETCSLSYVIYDKSTKDSVVIDPVLNYCHERGEASTDSINLICSFIKSNKLNLHYILETHVHADHMSGAAELKKKVSKAKIGISVNIKQVQQSFAQKLDIEVYENSFDILLDETVKLIAGSLPVRVIETPGHTPTCITYKIGDFLFTGDTLFMPDSGTGRCDFPMGSAASLYDSITQKIYSLPDDFYIFTGHDYKPNNRNLIFKVSVGDCKRKNIHIKSSTGKEEFIYFRETRDKKLNAPKLLIPSLQVNVNGGRFPRDSNKKLYLKLPIIIKPAFQRLAL